MEANHEIRDAARRLRRRMSLPEVLLWKVLRGSGIGLHFRKQHPLGPYVLDFYCDEAKLAVEVDGYAHGTDDRPERDARRDAWLAEKGVRTLRISAREVLRSPDDAARTILAFVEDHPL
jgi:very-short-patch-repair endonuclease